MSHFYTLLNFSNPSVLNLNLNYLKVLKNNKLNQGSATY